MGGHVQRQWNTQEQTKWICIPPVLTKNIQFYTISDVLSPVEVLRIFPLVILCLIWSISFFIFFLSCRLIGEVVFFIADTDFFDAKSANNYILVILQNEAVVCPVLYQIKVNWIKFVSKLN